MLNRLGALGLAGLVVAAVVDRQGTAGAEPGTTSSAGRSTSAATGLRAGQLAERQAGVPYLWGANGRAPGGGRAYDCSGLVIFAGWRAAGADWPDATADQLYRHWPRVKTTAARPGDLLVWDWGPGSRPGMDHVAIVTTRGRFVEAPRRGVPVRIRSLAGARPSAVVRPERTW